MAKLRATDDVCANLNVELTRTLRELPFRHYKTYDGKVECGHLLHPSDYQRLMLWLKRSAAQAAE